MSKLLKVIVNIFLIAAILIAVAIIVPPLAGVTTTIVDTSSMNTNLPLGSITYSTDIDVFDIQPGDEILKENDSSTYAYIIRETDPSNGRFTAISAADPNGAVEEVMLRNTVSKVAVVIPYIGYIMIAMHSIEGIIIVVLIVVLMIILFILSELWKVRPEELEEEEEAEQEEAPQVTAREETEIDTDVVQAAVEEKHTAVQNEELGLSREGEAVEEEPDYTGMTRAERRAAKKARKKAEKAARLAARGGETNEGADEVEGMTGEAGEMAADEASLARETAEALPETADAVADAAEEEQQILEALADLEAAEVKEEDPMAVLPDSSGEGVQTLAELAEEMEAKAIAAGTDGGYSLSGNLAEDLGAATEVYVQPDGEAEQTVPYGDSLDELLRAERFAPVPRPAMDEILEQSRASGREAGVKKDDKSGISLVDLSDLL